MYVHGTHLLADRAWGNLDTVTPKVHHDAPKYFVAVLVLGSKKVLAPKSKFPRSHPLLFFFLHCSIFFQLPSAVSSAKPRRSPGVPLVSAPLLPCSPSALKRHHSIRWGTEPSRPMRVRGVAVLHAPIGCGRGSPKRNVLRRRRHGSIIGCLGLHMQSRKKTKDRTCRQAN